MGFNWVTFFAQIINLFVLVWLMKRFLYGPIVSVIEKRQAFIEGKVKSAAKAESAAQRKQNELQKQTEQWQQTRQERINALYAELEDMRREQTDHIRLEGEGLRQKMQDDLNRETASLQLEIRDLMAQNFLDLSRKALADFSALTPMDQAVALFQKKVQALSKAELTALQKTARKTGVVQVETSTKLSPKTQTALNRFMAETVGDVDMRYTVNPDLILGIEVVIGETVLEWHLKSYLDTFVGNLNTALAGLIVKE